MKAARDEGSRGTTASPVAVLTPSADEGLRRAGLRYLLIRLEYSRGPCPDDWCPLIPRVVVEPSGEEPGEQYAELRGHGGVFVARRLLRSIRAGTLVIDFRRGRFLVKGSPFEL